MPEGNELGSAAHDLQTSWSALLVVLHGIGDARQIELTGLIKRDHCKSSHAQASHLTFGFCHPATLTDCFQPNKLHCRPDGPSGWGTGLESTPGPNCLLLHVWRRKIKVCLSGSRHKLLLAS